jgi:exodeoxyribonuclease-5
MSEATLNIEDDLDKPSTVTVDLGEQQLVGKAKAVAWYQNLKERGFRDTEKEDLLFTLAGYAGTGKTTTFNAIVEELQLSQIKYMAYTNMAAKVMRDVAGVPAKTIHSTIYKTELPDEDTLNALAAQVEEETDPRKQEILRQELIEAKTPSFHLRAREDFVGVQLFLLDECSMVDEDLLQDLFSFNIPILALGDPGQLSPPKSVTGGLFTRKPNVLLTEIFRQALDNPIIEASLQVRKGYPLKAKPFTMPEESEMHQDGLALFNARGVTHQQWHELMKMHSFTICWKNDTRHQLNDLFRKGEGLYEQSPYVPLPGETVVCRSNSKEKGLFNGMYCTLISVEEEFLDTLNVILQPFGEERKVQTEIFKAPFQFELDPEGEKNLKSWQFKDAVLCNYGYAGTAHTSQGSQYESVLIYDENVLRWPKVAAQRTQWLYTSITRAQKRATLMIRIGK